MTRKELTSTLALGSIFAFRMLGLFMILPIFSVYAAHLPQATPTLIGFALGAYGLTQALFQLPFGIWSDFISRKKIILLGLIIFALGSIAAAMSHTIGGIIIGRALQGAGAIGSTTIALVGDLTAEENRTTAMAIIGITIGLSFVVAIVVGPSLGHWIGIQGIFWLTAGFAGLGMLMLWGVPTPSYQHQEFNLQTLPQQLKMVFLNPNLQRLNLSIFLAHAILTASFIVIPPLLMTQYHIALNHQWKIYLPIFLLVLLFIGYLLRKRRTLAEEKRQWLACIVLILLSQIIFPVSHFIVLCIQLFLFFLGFTFLEALLPSLVSQSTQANYRGTATGVFSCCQFLGIFLGGLGGGYLMQHYQAFGVFLGNTLLATLWLFIMLAIQPD